MAPPRTPRPPSTARDPFQPLRPPGAPTASTARIRSGPPERILTTRQEAFFSRYLGNGGNATEAYHHAYGTRSTAAVAGQNGWKLLSHPEIRSRLAAISKSRELATAKMAERLCLDREAIMIRLGALASYDVRDVLEWDSAGRLQVKPSAVLTGEVAYAIESIEQGKDGRLKIKMADKRAALMDLAKLQGLLVDRHQQLDAAGRPIDPGQATFVLKVEVG